MTGMFFTMEWGYISVMHVVESGSVIASEDKIFYVGKTLCLKKISMQANTDNPVKNYIQVENYLDNPKFSFLDDGDTVSEAICCAECMKAASLKLMVEESEKL